jgi:hypothetical protein
MATPPCWRCLMNTRTLPQEGFLLLGGSFPTFSSLGRHSTTGSCQPKNSKSPADRIPPKRPIGLLRNTHRWTGRADDVLPPQRGKALVLRATRGSVGARHPHNRAPTRSSLACLSDAEPDPSYGSNGRQTCGPAASVESSVRSYPRDIEGHFVPLPVGFSADLRWGRVGMPGEYHDRGTVGSEVVASVPGQRPNQREAQHAG